MKLELSAIVEAIVTYIWLATSVATIINHLELSAITGTEQSHRDFRKILVDNHRSFLRIHSSRPNIDYQHAAIRCSKQRVPSGCKALGHAHQSQPPAGVDPGLESPLPQFAAVRRGRRCRCSTHCAALRRPPPHSAALSRRPPPSVAVCRRPPYFAARSHLRCSAVRAHWS